MGATYMKAISRVEPLCILKIKRDVRRSRRTRVQILAPPFVLLDDSRDVSEPLLP